MFHIHFPAARLQLRNDGWYVYSELWNEWQQVTDSDVDDILRAAGVKYRRNLIANAKRSVRQGLNAPDFGKRANRQAGIIGPAPVFSPVCH